MILLRPYSGGSSLSSQASVPASGCGNIQWSVVDLLTATPLSQKDSLSSTIRCISIAPQVQVWVPIPCQNVYQLDLVLVLCKQPQLLWAPGTLVSYSHAGPPWSGSYNSLPPFVWHSLHFAEGEWYRCPFCSWALWWQLFSILHPVVSLYINHHPIHKEHSLMRSEGCTNLWVER